MMMTPARKPPDTSTYSGRFAVRLRMLREKAGLTPEQVAEALDVSPNAVYRWESDLNFPRISLFPKLAELYGISKTRDLLPPK